MGVLGTAALWLISRPCPSAGGMPSTTLEAWLGARCRLLTPAPLPTLMMALGKPPLPYLELVASVKSGCRGEPKLGEPGPCIVEWRSCRGCRGGSLQPSCATLLPSLTRISLSMLPAPIWLLLLLLRGCSRGVLSLPAGSGAVPLQMLYCPCDAGALSEQSASRALKCTWPEPSCSNGLWS